MTADQRDPGPDGPADAEFSLRDEPIDRPGQDRFGRDEFAARISTAISKWDLSKSSLVIGLDGEWGEGKTSVLELLEPKLRQGGALVAWFNPWLFGRDETAMVLEFFKVVRRLCENSTFPARSKEDVLKRLRAYSSPVAMLLGTALPGWAQRIGTAVLSSAVQQLLNDPPLIEQRVKLRELVGTSEKRMVIFVDDIDRLTPDEALRVSAFIRLVGDFPQVAYVLSYESRRFVDLLSRALGGDQTGELARSFRDRLVQLEVRLPAVTDQELVRFHRAAIRAALKQAGLEQHAPEAEAFEPYFDIEYYLLRSLFSKPRSIRRYAASLSLTLAAAGDDVNPNDMALLELVRLFAPSTYELLRQDPTRYTGGGSVIEQLRRGAEHLGKRGDERKELLDKLLVDVAADVRPVIERVARKLLPQLAGEGYGSHGTAERRRAKRFSEPEVVGRYFRLGLLPDELPTGKITGALEAADGGDPHALVDLLRNAAVQDSAVLQLRDAVELADGAPLLRLTRSLAAAGTVLAPEYGQFERSPWESMAAAVGHSFARLTFSDDAYAIAKDLPIAFLAETTRWAEEWAKETDQPDVLERFRVLAVERIGEGFVSGDIWGEPGFGRLMAYLRRWNPEHASSIVTNAITGKPERAYQLLRTRIQKGFPGNRLELGGSIGEEVDLRMLLQEVEKVPDLDAEALRVLREAVSRLPAELVAEPTAREVPTTRSE